VGIMQSGSARAGLVAAVVASAVSLAGPVSTAAADATVSVRGGDATSVVNCQNLAPDPVVQRNRCKAKAEAGTADLHDVDIYFAGEPVVQANGGGVGLISVGGGSATASAVCVNESGGVVRGRSINVCRARAQGGSVVLRNVQIVIHHEDGSTTTRRRDVFAAANRGARGNAWCASLTGSAPFCAAGAGGGDVLMHHVDVVEASGVRRTNVDLSVHGGDATAQVTCRNSSSGALVQINVCSATAKGGDALLRNVRLNVFED
jgi:hypothetical protein